MNIEIFSLVFGAVAFLVILSLGLPELVYYFRRHSSIKPAELHILLVELPRRTEDDRDRWVQFLEFLAALRYPVSLELAVRTVGANSNFYAAVPRHSLQAFRQKFFKLWERGRLRDVRGYIFLNSHGITRGVTVRTSGGILSFSRDHAFNFSNINEIGEGALIQIVPHSFRGSRSLFATLRIVASAQSEDQAEEILGGLTQNFKGSKIERPRDFDVFLSNALHRTPEARDSSEFSCEDLAEVCERFQK